MLLGVLDPPLINMGFRVNLYEVSDITEAAFKDVLKISFGTLFVNSRYKMYWEMGVLLIQMLYLNKPVDTVFQK